MPAGVGKAVDVVCVGVVGEVVETAVLVAKDELAEGAPGQQRVGEQLLH